MYVSCSTLACTIEDCPDVRDVIFRIKGLGFGAFDLAAFEGWQNVNPSVLARGDEAWCGRLVEAVRQSGMRVSSINAGPSKPLNDPAPESFEQYRKEYAALCDLARSVGCANITVQPGRAMEGRDAGELFDAAAQHLAELAPLGEAGGVTLSVEGHQGSLLEKPADALRMMERLWPGVGFTYDPSHFCMQGIALGRTEALLDYTRHVHVRNASVGQMQETFEGGEIDFAWLVSALRDRGYEGAVTIEYFGGFDKDFTSTLALREALVGLGVEA